MYQITTASGVSQFVCGQSSLFRPQESAQPTISVGRRRKCYPKAVPNRCSTCPHRLPSDLDIATRLLRGTTKEIMKGPLISDIKLISTRPQTPPKLLSFQFGRDQRHGSQCPFLALQTMLLLAQSTAQPHQAFHTAALKPEDFFLTTHVQRSAPLHSERQA
jgi:hypothetical protein